MFRQEKIALSIYTCFKAIKLTLLLTTKNYKIILPFTIFENWVEVKGEQLKEEEWFHRIQCTMYKLDRYFVII